MFDVPRFVDRFAIENSKRELVRFPIKYSVSLIFYFLGTWMPMNCIGNEKPVTYFGTIRTQLTGAFFQSLALETYYSNPHTTRQKLVKNINGSHPKHISLL